MLAAAVPLLISAGILWVFVQESWRFFQVVPVWNFLTDTQWTPQFNSQQFGIGVLISATLLVTAIALLVAVPLGILAAFYLTEYAPQSWRSILRPLLNSLSGVPTIVYGYFALLLVTPVLQQLVPTMASFNALSAGLVTGLLVTPIVAALVEDALDQVEPGIRQGAYACGLTRAEMSLKILLPEVSPSVIAAITLAASRVLGETMIAAIAAGQIPNLTLNPLVPVETMTAFIVQVSLGDVPTDSLLFHTIFAVGMTLFLMTLVLNIVGNRLMRRYGRIHQTQSLPTAATPAPAADLEFKALGTFPDGKFVSNLWQRRWLDRLLGGLGGMAALAGPLVLGVLSVVTLRLGLPQLDWQFLTSFTSGDPAKAGILGALAGTLWLVVLTTLFAVPMGIAAAIFLEEYVPDRIWSRVVEINLANATAVPGILYGILGVAVFAENLRWLTGGRSILAASMMMTLLVLPLLITAARTALRRVPVTLKRGGYAVGMSRWQVIWHIVLPTARPGLLTALLFTGSRVIGEASPLIAIGAVEFITFVPKPTLEGLQSPFTTLTTQIFFWLLRPQPLFQQKAAAAVVVLCGIVLLMNVLASWLRDRLQKLT